MSNERITEAVTELRDALAHFDKVHIDTEALRVRHDEEHDVMRRTATAASMRLNAARADLDFELRSVT